MELRERCESRDVVDPRSRFAMREVVESYVAEGTTVLPCTQYLEEADGPAERVVILDEGRVVAAALATVSITGATATYRRIDH